MRIGEPREQITQLDAYHSRPARRVLADIDRRARRQFACEADGDAVPFSRQPDGCQWTPARICCRTCRGGLHRQRELSLSHAGNRSLDRSRVHAHISRRYLMPAQCCRSLVDAHPTWRTAKLRKVARLDVAPLNRGILHPRRAVQRLSWAWRVATVTRRHEDLAQQNPQERCLRVPGVDSRWRWRRCVTSDHAARMPYVRCSYTAIRFGWRSAGSSDPASAGAGVARGLQTPRRRGWRSAGLQPRRRGLKAPPYSGWPLNTLLQRG